MPPTLTMLLNISDQPNVKKRIKSLSVKLLNKTELDNDTIKEFIQYNTTTKNIQRLYDKHETPYREMKGIKLKKLI